MSVHRIERTPQWVRICAITLTLLAGPAMVSTSGESTPIAVRQLLERPSAFDGKLVTVEGEVAQISYIPEIRQGSSYYFFILTDQGRILRVASRHTALLTPHDRVRLTGTFVAHGLAAIDGGTGPELDATSGNLAIQARPNPTGSAPKNPESLAIPINQINTPLSVVLGIAAIGSMLFSAIAASTVFFYSRRANIHLLVRDIRPLTILFLDTDRYAQVTLRLFSTRSLVPFLTEEVELQIARGQPVPGALRAPDGTANFPLRVAGDLVLEARFKLPNNAAVPDGTSCRIVLHDAFSTKIFTHKLKVSGALEV